MIKMKTVNVVVISKITHSNEVIKKYIPNVAVVSEKEANRMSHADAILSLTFEIVFFELEVQITESDLSKTRSNQNCQNSKCTVI
jgi:hypothetical protein